MSKVNDLTGKKFNHLTVIRPLATNEHGKMLWEVLCDCGNHRVMIGTAVKSGHVKSCGCIKNDGHSNLRHGLANSSEYATWKGILRRCKSKQWKQYKDYGGRGVYVVDRWLKFENFIEDMGRKPSAEYQIDRIDNNGPYCKENCRWVTASQNCNNKSNNKVFKLYDAESGELKEMTLTEIARKFHVNYGTLQSRLNRGKSIESALSTKVRSIKSAEPQVFELDGKKMTLKEIAEQYGISYNTLYNRLYIYMMPLHLALSQPVRRRK